jgi:hypothetical protein
MQPSSSSSSTSPSTAKDAPLAPSYVDGGDGTTFVFGAGLPHGAPVTLFGASPGKELSNLQKTSVLSYVADHTTGSGGSGAGAPATKAKGRGKG